MLGILSHLEDIWVRVGLRFLVLVGMAFRLLFFLTHVDTHGHLHSIICISIGRV